MKKVEHRYIVCIDVPIGNPFILRVLTWTADTFLLPQSTHFNIFSFCLMEI